MALLKDDVVRGSAMPWASHRCGNRVEQTHPHVCCSSAVWIDLCQNSWNRDETNWKCVTGTAARCSFVHFSTVCGVISWLDICSFIKLTYITRCFLLWHVVIYKRLSHQCETRYFGKCVFLLVLQVYVGYFPMVHLSWDFGVFQHTLTKIAPILCTCSISALSC